MAIRGFRKMNAGLLSIKMISAFIGVIAIGLTAHAEDLILSPPVENRAYTSDSSIIVKTGCTVDSGWDVSLSAVYTISFEPGFRIANGAVFSAGILDADGLPNRWEIQAFRNLDQGPDGDYDGDLLTNLEEYLLGTDPVTNNPDNDGDGLPDRWELDHFGAIHAGPEDDSDDDGYSNLKEFMYDTNPRNREDRPRSYVLYEYDELNRIKRILRRVP